MIIKLSSTSFILIIILHDRPIRMLYLLDILFWLYGYKIFEYGFCTGAPKIVQSELSILLDMTFQLDIFLVRVQNSYSQVFMTIRSDELYFIHSILSGFFFPEYNRTAIKLDIRTK